MNSISSADRSVSLDHDVYDTDYCILSVYIYSIGYLLWYLSAFSFVARESWERTSGSFVREDMAGVLEGGIRDYYTISILISIEVIVLLTWRLDTLPSTRVGSMGDVALTSLTLYTHLHPHVSPMTSNFISSRFHPVIVP